MHVQLDLMKHKRLCQIDCWYRLLSVRNHDQQGCIEMSSRHSELLLKSHQGQVRVASQRPLNLSTNHLWQTWTTILCDAVHISDGRVMMSH